MMYTKQIYTNFIWVFVLKLMSLSDCISAILLRDAGVPYLVPYDVHSLKALHKSLKNYRQNIIKVGPIIQERYTLIWANI